MQELMVRMQIPGRMVPVRIGYVTRARRDWVAECFGGSLPPQRTTSAKMACYYLVRWACLQPSIAPFFSGLGE